MLNKQHQGFNLQLLGNTLALDDEIGVQKFKLMMEIDKLGVKGYWTQEDYEYWRMHVDMMADKNFTRRNTFLFYLNWMADVWEGTAISPIETVVDSALCFEESL